MFKKSIQFIFLLSQCIFQQHKNKKLYLQQSILNPFLSKNNFLEKKTKKSFFNKLLKINVFWFLEKSFFLFYDFFLRKTLENSKPAVYLHRSIRVTPS